MNLKRKIFEKKNVNHRVEHEDHKAPEQISQHIIEILKEIKNRPIVFVCIGSDRSTGDALGPLVGTKLKEKSPPHFHVYGTLDEPIHAVNLNEKMSDIYAKHKNPFIIGIDACLGRLKSVGVITVCDGPLKPGAGVNKELPDVGEVHITGIVNVSGFMEYLVLQNTRLSLVMRIAEVIAEGIYQSSKQLEAEIKVEPAQPILRWGLF